MRRHVIAAVGLACVGWVAGVAHAADPGEVRYGAWGVDLAAMDPEVKPGDDFFRYVNGHWLATAQIPPDRSATGAFLDLRLRSEARMGEIVAELQARPYDGLSDEEKKLRDLYDAFLDRAQIDSRGLAPARKDLDDIAGLKTLDEVATAMGTRRLGLGGPFAVWIGIEDKHPDTYSIEITQSGLGLPNRDYYLRGDKAIVETREAYKKYLASMLTLGGIPDGAGRAERIYALEASLAKVEWANADRRDAIKTYNPMSFSELEGLAPGFRWKAYFAAAGIPLAGPRGERQAIVHEKSAFPELAKVFADTPVEVWRDYLTARFLHGFAAYLPHEFDETDFAFYGTALYGNPQQLDRAKRAVHLLDGELGEALGKLYVAKYFPPEAKVQADRLVQNLLRAYDADIRVLPWMTPATREKALDKLHKFTPHIGYPETWRDYSALTIRRDDLLGDIQAGSVFEWNRRLKRIDQPVDKSEWGMSPPTVNAYYTANMNAIFFPAAILQAPFFDPHADDAVNYGGIGAVIGHEISHGFDDQGSKYDGSGALDNWWTDEDRRNFDAATKQLGTQYDSYEPQPGLHVKGAYTMGENIADLAGLTIAYKAYHLSLHGKPAPVLDGLTGDQRFYIAYSQSWREKNREAQTRARLLSNPHSPAAWRVNGVVRNDDGWYKAFDIKPGDKFYLPPDKRVRLW